MITRILKQVKVFDIESAGMVLSGHGFFDRIPGLTWVNDCIWESDEKCQSLLKDATADWEKRRSENPWGTTNERPRLNIYWKTIDIQENGA